MERDLSRMEGLQEDDGCDENDKGWAFSKLLKRLSGTQAQAWDVVRKNEDAPDELATRFMNLIARHVHNKSTNEMLGAAVRAAFEAELNKWVE
jgi:hypothetical protein